MKGKRAYPHQGDCGFHCSLVRLKCHPSFPVDRSPNRRPHSSSSKRQQVSSGFLGCKHTRPVNPSNDSSLSTTSPPLLGEHNQVVLSSKGLRLKLGPRPSSPYQPRCVKSSTYTYIEKPTKVRIELNNN